QWEWTFMSPQSDTDSARSWTRTASVVSARRAVHLRQGTAGGRIAVGAEVREVSAGYIFDERELIFDDRSLPFLRPHQGKPDTGAGDTAKTVQNVFHSRGAGHMRH